MSSRRVNILEAICILCGKSYQHGCTCKFKKPPRAHYAGGGSLLTTVPHTMTEVLREIQSSYKWSAENDRKCIFKFEVHWIK